MPPARLIAILSIVRDPRVARTRVHKLVDVLLIALLAIINGGGGWDDMADFAEVREAWLRGFLELPGGPPSADTFRRIFEAIDPNVFGRCLAEITADLVSDLEGKVVAIDGKTLRGSFDRRRGHSPLHVVSAWVAEQHLTLGQVVTEQKSNEVTAIPELLAILDLEGATVTIDAMGCQKKIAAAIAEKKADYILALKDNHPLLREEVDVAFTYPKESGIKRSEIDTCVRESEGHGRHETRRVSVLRNVGGLTGAAKWANLRSVVRVERERRIEGKTSHETSYYLSSLVVRAATMEKRIRAHWSIENNLHWSLDVIFGEDASRVRSRAGAANLTQLRKLALTLLKRESSKAGKSIVKKRKIAGWVPDYAFLILGTISQG